MGKTVAASRAEVPNWFDVGVIASPGGMLDGEAPKLLAEIGDVLGVSGARVGQIERGALAKLCEAISTRQ